MFPSGMSESEDGIVNHAQIADDYWMLHASRDAWTLLDMRPYLRNFESKPSSSF